MRNVCNLQFIPELKSVSSTTAADSSVHNHDFKNTTSFPHEPYFKYLWFLGCEDGYELETGRMELRILTCIIKKEIVLKSVY